MEPEEAYSIKLISYVKISDQGLLHVETEIDNDKYKNYIYLNKVRIGEGTIPQFYLNNLYYVKGEKTKSLFIQNEYGEPKKLFTLGKISKYVFHKKGILIIGEEKTNKKDPFYANKLKYRFDGRGLLRSRQSLYIFDRELRKILEGDFDVTDIATNGDRVIVSTTQNGDDYGLDDLYEVDVNNGETRRITKGEGKISAIAMNEKGDIAYLGHRKGLTPWATQEIILPEEEKSFMCGNNCGSSVLTDLFDGSTNQIIFYNDEILSLGQIKGSVDIYRISDNKVDKLTNGNKVVKGFDYNGKLAYFYTTPEKPSILYYGEEYDPNPNVRGLSPTHIEGEIEGWAIITGKENPTILFIHGGPHTTYGYGYFIEFQFFANNGYNVIYCNPRGSQGYGEDFAKACVGDWGGKDMEDILNFTKKVILQFDLKGKIGVTGGSYGGFMTNWIVTQTDFFSAAISERSISNLVSMCGTSDIGFWFNTIEVGIKDPWSKDGIQKLMNFSPIYYVKDVKTPTMLIQGEQDYRCPIEQAEQFFIALKMNNVPTMLVRYQGDGHEHARKGNPKNMKDRLKIKKEWFDKYLK
jgi:dipeptidyl aminopeptidase/acylaminoacyl peptidase